MKRRLMTAFAVLSVIILGFASAEAQSSDTLVVNIPFTFTAGDRDFPAGKYTIKPVSLKRSLMQSEDGSISTTVPVNYNQKKSVTSAARIVFNKYEERYFLTRIYQAGAEIGYDLWHMSKEERLAKNKKARKEVTITGN